MTGALPNNLGRFASNAPTLFHIHIQSQHGNGSLPNVTCARIILPTWCANWTPHAHKNGTKSGEYTIAEWLKAGWDSHAIWMATGSKKGRRRLSGLVSLVCDRMVEESAREAYTLRHAWTMLTTTPQAARHITVSLSGKFGIQSNGKTVSRPSQVHTLVSQNNVPMYQYHFLEWKQQEKDHIPRKPVTR